MLKQLHIYNIILIETAQVFFTPGLNVLTGETGSGKSAMMNALALITGERADNTLIRKGENKGSVEAYFDITHLPNVKRLLEEQEIEYSDDELVLRREISISGKSRALINHQVVPVGILKQVAVNLLSMLGQHANQKLFSIDQHREILDLFGHLQPEVEAFSLSWEEENKLRQQLSQWKQTEGQRWRDIETYQRELAELQGANLKENEEEELFAEYSLMTHAEEFVQNLDAINQALSGDKHAVIPSLNRHKPTLDKLTSIDPKLSELKQNYETALLELQEIGHTLRNLRSRTEIDPQRTQAISDRLSFINQLKKRYGSSAQEMQSYLVYAQEKLNQLQEVDSKIEEFQNRLQEITAKNQTQSHTLTQKRQESAEKLQKAINTELRGLNMPKVDFQCLIAPQPCSRFGKDQVEFFICPNVGENLIPVRECASGGELSRLLLALQTILAGKEAKHTLVFDEIDANIGGETAAVVGSKLCEIAHNHQILCITHFPQVAKQADHHIQISKTEQDGRTRAHITHLDEQARQRELSRMAGGNGFSSPKST